MINGAAIVEGFHRLRLVATLRPVCAAGCASTVGFNHELSGNDIGVGVGNNWFGRTVMAATIARRGPPSVICIRLLVGLVFLSEGIQKFMYPDQLGRAASSGSASTATFFADLDGVVEIVCGTLVLLGLLTRVAAVPLLIDMVGAIVLTKLRALQPGGFLGVEGFWGMAHAARTDLSMLLGLIFLLWSGPGRWSLDRRLSKRATACGAR